MRLNRSTFNQSHSMDKFKVSRATAYRYRQQVGIPSKAAGLN
ncbi:hypothetical protein AB71_2940 [Escherichia coli 1-182-04_S1_C3]|nr:hypothetical protein AB71_2940 [Escherichia coli 1-182-04_S1_C3]EZK29758.1 hypothetical protein AB12_2726 [Escherichia coli 1-182-04_S1_C1]KDA67829.1 hypothetical protein AB40_2761 [Escherichia coli 1-182-04_S1_C2]